MAHREVMERGASAEQGNQNQLVLFYVLAVGVIPLFVIGLGWVVPVGWWPLLAPPLAAIALARVMRVKARHALLATLGSAAAILVVFGVALLIWLHQHPSFDLTLSSPSRQLRGR